MQAYPGRDPIAEFFRGQITLRKLRVMTEYLPENSPANWHTTDGRPYSLTESLLWRNLWAAWQLQVLISRIGGDKKAKMPSDNMPAFPWERGKSSDQQTFGSLGERDPEEALDYLLSLE